jgi:ABC-type transport system substrate-binding protein
MLSRRSFVATSVATAALSPAYAETAKVLRVAMTTADVPTVTGIPNNGSEGFRFLGYPAYDALVNWDFKHTDQLADITPGLFTSWKIDPADPLRWRFTVRQGVTFHDGSAFDADAVIWNLQRVFDDKSPQYDAPAAPIVRSTVSMLTGYAKQDDSTIILTTAYPFSFLPYVLTRVLIASPAQWEKSGRSWAGFAKSPSGTGPFRITRVVAGQYVEMSRNDDYWDRARIPRLDKLVVYPMAEPTTRLAALRSGQVDWIEVPPPDAIPSLRAAGFDISLWPYPHTYPYVLNTTQASAFHDVRVRQAANYAIDRDGLCKLINGTGRPAIGLYPPENPVFGQPVNRYSYDPARARQLLQAAGYGPDKPCRAKIMISTSGSGQMVPIPMNEFLQQNFKDVGIEVSFDVVEWGSMLMAIRNLPTAAASHGADGINCSLSFTDPSTMFHYYATESYSPASFNWGHWSDPDADTYLKSAQEIFDTTEQTRLLAKAHAIVVDAAPWLFICHDLNPRALSSKVKDFHPAQSWFQDFTQVTMA